MSDKPPFIRNQATLIGPRRQATITTNFRARQEALLSVDEAVRGIVSALRSTGELSNTYVMFTSDNGFFHGEHRVPNGKMLVYEPSSRVPLLIRGPGIKGGRSTREMAVNPDLAATVLDVTGAKPTRSIDGRSLIPYAQKPSRRTRRPVLHEIFRQGAGGDLEQDGTASRAAAPARPAAGALLQGDPHQPLGLGRVLRRQPRAVRPRARPTAAALTPCRPALPPHRAALRKELRRPGEVQGEVVPPAGGAHPRPVRR